MGCENAAHDWAYDGMDPSELCGPGKSGTMLVYSQYPEFYMPLCKRCHRPRDKAWRARMKDEYAEFCEWKARRSRLASVKEMTKPQFKAV